jgi:glyoxylase-like metal-dependent hydrolase (beta-lactamase superfamily II)
VCRAFDAPLACHEADADAAAGRVPMRPNNWILRFGQLALGGPPCPVDRVLRDGDEVRGLRVVHTPGHTPGHIAFFRESDGLLLAGDVLSNVNALTGKPGLCEPFRPFSVDPALNRRSVPTLVALQPKVVCFGHGPPLYDASRLEQFAELLQRRRPVRGAAPGGP